MHGLINKSLQAFLSDSFGSGLWLEIAHRSGVAKILGADAFEAMKTYDDSLTEAMLGSAAEVLNRPLESLLEDFGTYLICHERMEPLRRLLRFGGVSFTDFLYSLDDLQGRSRLAVPDFTIPEFFLEDGDPGRFTLVCRGGLPGFGHVMAGVLRALADDYGALAVLDPVDDATEGDQRISIKVYDPAFHAGRRFDLAPEVR